MTVRASGGSARKASDQMAYARDQGIEYLVGAGTSGVGLQHAKYTMNSASGGKVTFASLGLKNMADTAYVVIAQSTRSSGVAATSVDTITVPAFADLVDTDYFTLPDGVHTTSLLFEFDTAGDGVTTGRVQVDVSGATTAADVALILTAAINAQNALGNTFWSAVDGGDGTIDLTHDFEGTMGNVTITENVADASFALVQPTGGADILLAEMPRVSLNQMATDSFYIAGPANGESVDIIIIGKIADMV